MAINHYENFPVASILLPRHLVPAVEAIYAFARSADDLADEGDCMPQQRLDALEAYEAALDAIEGGRPVGGTPFLDQAAPMFGRLAAVIAQYDLPMQPLRDLLSAFKQDVATTRYATASDLIDYCRRSANPVGRLMLSLYGCASPANVGDSDAICSALQLINFWQDVAIDRHKDRIYIPLEDLARFQILPDQLDRAVVDGAWRALMGFEIRRARAMMLEGAPLALRLPGRIGWELRMVVQGGLRILERIEAAQCDVFRHRPQLGWRDWVVIAWRSVRM